MQEHSSFSLLITLIFCFHAASGICASTDQPKVIYGEDNRLEYYEVTDETLKMLSESTVVLVFKSDLTANGEGYDINTADTLASMNFCSDEPFLNQPTPGYCSGFLVAPNLIVTAGHCISNLSTRAAVFGFRMNGEDDLVSYFPADDVYTMTKVIASSTGNSDWAVVQLDRDVVGREPLVFRISGAIPDSQSVAVIGYPIGLPLKIAGGAYVRDNSNPDFFVTNTDTYGGNSGSAIVNLDTYEVEGVLVRGETDFTEDPQTKCKRSNVCPETGCSGEDCTRTTEWADIVLSLIQATATPTNNVATPTPTDTPVIPVTATPSWTPTLTFTPTFIQSKSGYLDTDLNHDGQVDSNDLLQFIEDFGITYPTPTPVAAR